MKFPFNFEFLRICRGWKFFFGDFFAGAGGEKPGVCTALFQHVFLFVYRSQTYSTKMAECHLYRGPRGKILQSESTICSWNNLLIFEQNQQFTWSVIKVSTKPEKNIGLHRLTRITILLGKFKVCLTTLHCGRQRVFNKITTAKKIQKRKFQCEILHRYWPIRALCCTKLELSWNNAYLQ